LNQAELSKAALREKQIGELKESLWFLMLPLEHFDFIRAMDLLTLNWTKF